MAGRSANALACLLLLQLLFPAELAAHYNRKLLDTRGLGLSPTRRSSTTRGSGFKTAENGEPMVKVNIDGRGHQHMPWSKAYRRARDVGVHEKVGLDPDAGDKAKGAGYRNHVNNHHRANRRGYYRHMDKLASDPQSIQDWHKRVQNAEVMKTKPGQHRSAQAHHRAQPSYKGPIILPHNG